MIRILLTLGISWYGMAPAAPPPSIQTLGKLTVVEISQPNCPFVQKHYRTKAIQMLQKFCSEKQVRWITVSSGKNATAEKLRQFLSRHAATPDTRLVDTNASIARHYNLRKAPGFILLNPDGTVAYTGTLTDQRGWDNRVQKPAQPWLKSAIEARLSGVTPATVSTPEHGCSIR